MLLMAGLRTSRWGTRSNGDCGDTSPAGNHASIARVACQNGDLLGTGRSDDGTEMSIGYRRLGVFSDRRGSVALSRVQGHVGNPQAVGEGPLIRCAVPTGFNANRGRNLDVDWYRAALSLGDDLNVAERPSVLGVLDGSKSLDGFVV
jgi:hypothetical protein